MNNDYIDYRDPEIYGKLDDVIEAFSYDFWAFVKSPKGLNPEGAMTYNRRKYKIRGSLQAWKKTYRYGESENANTSVRTGKFYCKYNVKLNVGDIIQKHDMHFRVIEVEDYDYGGIRQYIIERLGYEEIITYNFDEYIEERFDDQV